MSSGYSVPIGDLGDFDAVTLVNRMNAEEAKLPRKRRRYWVLRFSTIGDLIALLSQTRTQSSTLAHTINSVIAAFHSAGPQATDTSQ